MSIPFNPALPLAALERSREALARNGGALGPLIRAHLVPQLVTFELARSRRHLNTEREGLESGLESMLLALLKLAEEAACVTPGHLLNLHRLLGPAFPAAYRIEPTAPISPAHEPLEPERIPTALERLFEWIQSPGFLELHPIQQMTVAQMRLFQIQPFADRSEVTVSLFSQYFLVRRGYLPALFRPEDLAGFYRSLDQAFRFSSDGLLRLNIEAEQRSYRRIQEAL